MTDTSILGELIVGRVEPRIYAFTTNTIPNYLKVGDTYRPVEVRLDEWREHFPNLKREFDLSAHSPSFLSPALSPPVCALCDLPILDLCQVLGEAYSSPP